MNLVSDRLWNKSVEVLSTAQYKPSVVVYLGKGRVHLIILCNLGDWSLDSIKLGSK